MRKYVDVNSPLVEQGLHRNVHITINDVPQFATVYFLDIVTPLHKFGTYQAQSGDVDNLATPAFDSMVFNQKACLEMLGESLSYKACMHDELVLSETTTWKSNSESEEDVWDAVEQLLEEERAYFTPAGRKLNPVWPDLGSVH